MVCKKYYVSGITFYTSEGNSYSCIGTNPYNKESVPSMTENIEFSRYGNGKLTGIIVEHTVSRLVSIKFQYKLIFDNTDPYEWTSPRYSGDSTGVNFYDNDFGNIVNMTWSKITTSGAIAIRSINNQIVNFGTQAAVVQN